MLMWITKYLHHAKQPCTHNYLSEDNRCIISLNLTHIAKYGVSGLKVGRMTRAIWVTWVTFLEGQVGLVRKLNYLDVTWISHVL